MHGTIFYFLFALDSEGDHSQENRGQLCTCSKQGLFTKTAIRNLTGIKQPFYAKSNKISQGQNTFKKCAVVKVQTFSVLDWNWALENLYGLRGSLFYFILVKKLPKPKFLSSHFTLGLSNEVTGPQKCISPTHPCSLTEGCQENCTRETAAAAKKCQESSDMWITSTSGHKHIEEICI